MAYQPKSYKKFVATAATATLVASAIAPVASAATFTDVNKNYTEAVNYLVANKIAQGTSDTTFGTTASITRGDAAVMIANALGLDTSKAPESAFTDLNTRVKASVNALSAAGIINGKSTTQFAPDDNITRAEMAKVIALAYKLDKTGTTNEFTDVNSTFDEYVDALVKYEITLGKTESLFGATQNVTRGEFALFVFRAENLTPATPEVVSVSAINAKQIEVKFNKAIDASTLIDSADDTLAAGVLTFAKISGTGTVVVDGTSAASLSADGKVLTVNSASGAFDDMTYVVTLAGNTVKDTTGNFAPKYTSAVQTAEDSSAPGVTSVTKVNSSLARVNFSEPLDNAGVWSFKYADGSSADADVSLNGTTVADGYADVTLLAGAVAGKEITATIIGAKDFANNLISPNPVTVKFSKGAADGTKPTVSALNVLGLNKFEVKFTEEVQGFIGSDVTIDGSALLDVSAGTTALEAGEASVVRDSTDKTKYTVTLGTALSAGVHTVGLIANAVTDFSGEQSAVYSKVLDFKADVVAPKLVSSLVKKDAAGFEYLHLNFDEAVTPGTINALTATQVKDYVTTTGTVDLTGIAPVANTGNKEYKVKLADVEFNVPALVSGATYSVTLTGAFTDGSNALASASINFTRGTDSLTVAQTVATAVQTVGNPNEVKVTFTEDVDGASATNKANYNISGVVVENAKIVAGEPKAVYLTLQANSNPLNGDRNITINGVKTKDGVAMTSASTKIITLEENVKPTFTATLVSADTIKVSFSEAVTDLVGAGMTVADFEIKYNGNVLAEPAAFTAVYTTATGTTAVANSTVTEAYLKLAPGTIDDLGKSLTVATEGSDVKDAKSNTWTSGTVSVSK